MLENVEFKSLVDNSYKDVVELQKRRVLRKLERREQKLFKTKPKNLEVKDIRRRRLWTPWGDIWLSRRRYFDKANKSYRYLLDEYLELEGRNYVPIAYRALAIQNFHSFKSYKEIAKNIYNGSVSKQSIHNFIKTTRTTEIELKKKFNCPDGVLNINIDGIFVKKNVKSTLPSEIKIRRSASFHIKSFLFFTHSEEISKNRNQLQGRYMKYFIEAAPSRTLKLSEKWDKEDLIAQEVDKIISLYSNVKEIRVIGDGAKWIKSIATWIGGKYIADKFHMRKYIRDLLGRDKYYLGLKLINKDLKKDKLRNKLYKLAANPKTGEISKESIRMIGYIVNNHKYYLYGFKRDTISAIEGIQAHYISRYFKRQRKGWSEQNLSNIVHALTVHFNNESMLMH